MNKPFVALLCALTVMATVNMVIATGPMIQKVFVTNWQQNQNVTVTNPPAPPTVNLNVTAGKPALDVKTSGVVMAYIPGSTLYSVNITLSVRGYRDLAVGFHALLGSTYFVNRSNPKNVTVSGLQTTITYYNITWTAMYISYSSGPIAGLETVSIDHADGQGGLCNQGTEAQYGRAYYIPCTTVYPNYVSWTSVVPSLIPIGPMLTVHVNYMRQVAPGYYYDNCDPTALPLSCSTGDGLFLRGFLEYYSISYLSDNTTATFSAYATS